MPQDHPLRPIRTLVDQALDVLSPGFDQLYAQIGRPAVPPEKLLRALWARQGGQALPHEATS